MSHVPVQRLALGCALVVWLGLMTGCATLPVDPLARAQQLANDGRLTDALETLDQMRPRSPEYAAGRELANQVEKRLRRYQEHITAGLALREAQRHAAAVDEFAAAASVWPQASEAEVLLRATRYRVRSFGPGRPKGSGAPAKRRAQPPEDVPAAPNAVAAKLDPPVVAAPEDLSMNPVEETAQLPSAAPIEAAPETSPAEPGEGEVGTPAAKAPAPISGTKAEAIPIEGPMPPPGFLATTSGGVELRKEKVTGAVTSSPEPHTANSGEKQPGSPFVERIGGGPPSAQEPDARGGDGSRPQTDMAQPELAGLAAARQHLETGDRQQAIVLLTKLWKAHPGDRQIASTFAPVLHQRALLSYGQGRLQSAIKDWRVVATMPGKQTQARRFLATAEKELRARKTSR